MYKREQVYEATLKYFNGDELAANVWIDKYCLKNRGQYLELTPDDMHRRMAKEFARIEAKYPEPMSEFEIYHLLKDFKYIIPQGSPMAGLGNGFVLTSLSNCFVVGDHVDSYGGIMKSDEEQAQLMKRRGGVGKDISVYRPSGAIANSAPLGPNAGTILYMNRFSNTTREVQQDGRRGALMLSIDIKHPDAEGFIDKKMTPGEVTGANVSVKITDEFMTALEYGFDFIQTFPIDLDIWKNCPNFVRDLEDTQLEYNKLYSLEDSDNVKGCYAKVVNPRKIWDKIVHNAWKSAEPGILFWDQILNESPARFYGNTWKEISTNPCGEIPLPAYDSCRLISINLYSYLHNGFDKSAMLEDQLLIDHTKKAMRLMDDLVDLEIEKIDLIIQDIKSKIHDPQYQRVELELWEKIRQTAVNGRRTGLGVLGEADLIAGLGLRYGTPDTTEFSERLHQLIATAAYESSVELAQERGAFPMWESDKDIEASGFLTRMFELPSTTWCDETSSIRHTFGNESLGKEVLEKYRLFGRRNIGVLTIAPTGSTSLLTQTSSGIEPIFAAFHYRKKKIVNANDKFDYQDENGDKWVEFAVFHKPFIDWFSVERKMSFEQAKFILGEYSKEWIQLIFEASPYFKATAQDVDYVEKVKMQGAVQRWVDHSISVTVNMPESVTEEMVSDVYRAAYMSGCKGITVYRDNSRGNVLSTQSIKKVQENEDFEYVAAVKRPRVVQCDIFFKTAQKQPWIILVGKIQDKPYEVFAIPYNDKTKISKTHTKGELVKVGKTKYDLIGENGMPLIDDITSFMIETEQNETRSISALLRHRVNPKFIIESILGKFATISSFHKVIEKVLVEYVAAEELENKCPECQSKMTMTEGCMKCSNCGHAHCG